MCLLTLNSENMSPKLWILSQQAFTLRENRRGADSVVIGNTVHVPLLSQGLRTPALPFPAVSLLPRSLGSCCKISFKAPFMAVL